MTKLVRTEVLWKGTKQGLQLWQFVLALCVIYSQLDVSVAQNGTYKFTIPEGKPSGTVVGRLSSQGSPHYQIFSATPRTCEQNFQISSANGIITTTAVLDRDSSQSKDGKCNLTVSDVNTLPFKKYFVLIFVEDMNDNPPKFRGGGYENVVISEGKHQGAVLHKLIADDPDSGLNSTQNYRILSGNDDSIFKIVLKTENGHLIGELMLNTGKELDRETKDSYILNISASDGGNPPLKDYLLLNITVSDLNDNPPVFSPSNYTQDVLENVKIGTSILKVTATDKDIGTNAAIKYSIAIANYNTNPKFGIDQNTGEIQNYVHLDYETKKQYKLTIQAENAQGGAVLSPKFAQVVINVVDVNDNAPEIDVKFTEQGAKVDEDAKVNQEVVRVSVTDKDSGMNGEVNVTLEGGDGYFSMKYDARLSESVIYVGRPLDRETQSRFILTAYCIDNGSPPKSTNESFIINVGDVNDNYPKFDRQVYVSRIYENATINSLVARVHAKDKDEGSNAELVYSLANTLLSDLYRSWFAINNVTGEIQTASVLDREKAAQLVLTVIASDKGNPPLKTNCTVVVNISDNNDNNPEFNQSVYHGQVYENSPANTEIFYVFAKDPDLGQHSLIQYTIPNSNNIPFQVDLNSGKLFTTGFIDHEIQSSYTFQVVATDGGGRNASSTVNVQVLDKNDNSPEFAPVSYTKQVFEDIDVGSPIATVVAKDKDSGIYARLTYNITQGNNHGLFAINSTSGVISVAKNLDRETKDSHTFKVIAVDGGGKRSSNVATVDITVLDVNDEPPIFEHTSYNFTIVENSSLTVVGTVKAVSKDLGTNAHISYSITGGNTDNIFVVNDTGTIYASRSIDREKIPQLILKVQAKDGGTPALYGYTKVNIAVQDLNDNKPRFNNSILQVRLAENTQTGQIFYVVKAYDPDSGDFGRVTYTLLTNPGQIFTLNQNTGGLSLLKTVKFDTKGRSYTLNVRAQDNGSPPLVTQMTLNLTVVDVNDNAPVFLNTTYMVHVSELQSADSNIVKVSATDQDSGENARITYSFKAGTDTTKFGLRNDGWIFIKKQLDREDVEVYKITVVASDHGFPSVLTATADVTVIVDDVNDNNPKFKQKSYVFNVQEGKEKGTVVNQVSASDKDKGVNAKLTYSFESAVSEFVMNKETGVIKTNKILDREKKSSYVFTVVATDGGVSARQDKTLVTIVIQDVNDNSPVFNPSQYEKKVYEDVSVGTSLLKVSATDADEAGPNSDIQYAIVAGQQNSQVFSINSKSGEIKLSTALDREKKDRYILHIAARDNGSPPKDSIVMVSIYVLDVNDNPPKFLNMTDFVNVPEKLPVGGIVAQVKAVDQDDGDNGRIEYEIVQGNVGNTFTINVTSGVIRTRLVLDFERQNRYQLKISAKDMGQRQHTSYRWVNIYILDANDNRPTFEKNPIIASVYEGVPVNHVVKKIQARDDDSGSNSWIWYSIDSQSPDAHFKIDPSTGEIRTISLLDRESISEYTLIVRATDQAYTQKDRLYSTATLKIIVLDVNDNKPVFVSRNMTYVMEDEPFSFEVMSVVALDYDTGPRGKVEYRIGGGNHGKFSLHLKTGVLKKIGNLDYESQRVYVLNISATDEGTPPLSSYQLLTIFVVDVNDNPPEFTKNLFIGNVTEGAPGGTPVLSVTARDRDSGTNAELSYSIPSGRERQIFCVNATTGIITTNVTLDREERDSYSFLVYATGKTYPFRVSTATVKINVVDKNDQRPTFASPVVTRKVQENAPPGVFYTLVAQDLDYGSNAQVKYKILSGDVGGDFNISEDTGELSTVKRLDRETIAQYRLVVEAKDVTAPYYSTTCEVVIIVEDVNDNPPVFLKPQYSRTISELSAIGTSLINVTATDKDSGSNGEIVYSLSKDTFGVFTIGANTGVISSASKFDTSVKSVYDFYCSAHDQGSDQKMSWVKVTLRIQDMNTHAPVFLKTPYEVSIFPNTSAGNIIQTVTATDADINKTTNGKVTYRFKDSAHSNLFQLESNTGVLRTSSSFNNPPTGRYTLRIVAEDHGVPSKSGDGVVEVLIGAVQDDPPVFLNKTHSKVSVLENAALNEYVTTLLARNKKNDPVTYSIISGNLGNAFYIHPDTGVLIVKSGLDFEVIKEYELQLVATLKNSPSLNGYMRLNVSLIDVNDNDPVFHPANIVTQLEEDEGDFVARDVLIVNATDADSTTNGQLVYSIYSGNTDNAFSIDQTSGQIKTAKPLDRETVPSYTLVVKATDQGNPSRSSTSTVRVTVFDVNDNTPVFNVTTNIDVTEDARPGFVIATATATDADKDSQLVYTLKRESTANMFAVSRFTGLVTLLKALDYETTKTYNLTVSVSDGLHSADVDLRINVLDVNDNAPVFYNSSYQVTLTNSIEANKPLLQVKAYDEDSGSNQILRYSFLKTVPDFKINDITGVISSKKRIEVNGRDSLIQILAVATDQGVPSQRSFVYVRVLITREPKFDRARYSASVREDAVIGTSVMTVQATENAQYIPLARISYAIESGNFLNKFRIGQRSGTISINSPLDYETEDHYQLVIRASDDVNPSKEVKVTVLINVTDVNDLKPEFRKSQYLAQWNENVKVGTIVMNVSASDGDAGTNGKVWYSIESGDDKDSFSIDRNLGIIRTIKPLDHDAIRTHHLSVRASDEGNPPLHSEVSVTIQVLDLNDNPPVFHIPNPGRVRVPENSPVSTSFYNLTARDKDSDSNGRITYSIIGGDGKGLFLIDPLNGWLKTNVVFNYEDKSSYVLQVKATDAGSPPLQSNITITVHIQSVDEFFPVFSKSQYAFSVPGNAEIGDFVGQVSATDEDGGEDGILLYSFIDPKSDALEINTTSGVITVNRTLNDGLSLMNRERRSIDSYSDISMESLVRSRVRRETTKENDQIYLRVTADSGEPKSKSTTVYVVATVDYTCPGCGIITKGPQTGGGNISGTSLVIIIALAVLAGVILLVLVVVMLLIYSHRKRKRARKNPRLKFDGSFDEITVHPPSGNSNHAAVSAESIPGRTFPQEYAPLNRTTDTSNNITSTDPSETPGSASSGRGSSDGDFEEVPPSVRNGDVGSLHSDNYAVKTVIADSGIQQDDEDQISQLTISDGSGILHVDENKPYKNDKILSRMEYQSQESMHVFGEEGGGEADGGHDVGNLLYAKLAEVDADDESIAEVPRSFIEEGRDRAPYAGSLSSIIGSKEELSGSYNWDYLLDWGPQFQPLAEVFLEIGRMKDDVNMKKVGVRSPPSSSTPSSRLQAQLPGIATTDMLSSVSSLPRSGISPPSTQYTSPAFSPNFTPAITPLITRSPSVSPLDTAAVSPSFSPQGSRPTSTHINSMRIRRGSEGDSNSELSHSPSISDSESNLEIDV